MIGTRTLAVWTAAGAMAAAGAVMVTAGPLTPPAGPVASTYKTLGEVEPRIAINSTNTPGSAVAVYVISQPGSYYLTGNLVGQSGKKGILVISSHVTIDLCGFTLQGGAGTDDAIGVGISAPPYSNLTVRNGAIQNWVKEGVDGYYSNNCLLENLRVDSSAAGYGLITGTGSTIRSCVVQASSVGIVTAPGCLVDSCTVGDNIGGGISLGSNGTAVNCVARHSTGSAAYGIFAGDGCTLTGCTSASNAGNGIDVGNDCTILGCTSASNSLSGIKVANGGVVQASTSARNTGGYGIWAAGSGTTISACTSIGNTIDGIRVNNNCLVINCNANANGPTAAIGASGIFTVGSGNRLDSNTTTGNWYGIGLNGSNNFMVRNLSTGNAGGPNQLIAGNRWAQIINNPAAGFVSTDPWSNVQY